MGHAESNTGSLGQIIEKPCVCSRGHIFSPIIMKLVQNVSLNEISDEFKNKSLGQILEEPGLRSRGHIFSSINIKLGQNVCLDENLDELENGSCRVKN